MELGTLLILRRCSDGFFEGEDFPTKMSGSKRWKTDLKNTTISWGDVKVVFNRVINFSDGG